MRILVDENLPTQVMPVLEITLGPLGHQVDAIEQIKWKGAKDHRMILKAAERGYDALITLDRNQLKNRKEREAIQRSRIHWVGVRESGSKDPVQKVATTCATVIAGSVLVAKHLEHAERPQLVFIRTVQHHDRIEPDDVDAYMRRTSR